jgi:hypothetical protein
LSDAGALVTLGTQFDATLAESETIDAEDDAWEALTCLYLHRLP